MRRVWRSPYAPISIHAPLAGCDLGFFARQKYGFSISIHAPLAGCDAGYHARNWQKHDFNPRTPCGVRRKVANYFGVTVEISIHAPLAGCDSEIVSVQPTAFNFNPRTPCGVRPIRGDCPVFHNFISIHAPLAGCDELRDLQSVTERDFNPRTPCGVRPRCPSMRPRPAYFNPRTPCGVRHGKLPWVEYDTVFQSTHPLRGATPAGYLRGGAGDISIHAPLAGCDPNTCPDCYTVEISIHAPLAGCDRSGLLVHTCKKNFNPRTPCGVRQRWRL